MRNQDTETEPLPDPSYLVLEAFLDGETIERKALIEAFEDAGAREHFVDLLVVRGGIAALEPSAWSAGSGRTRSRPRWWAAAAAVILAVATGFIVGQRTVDATANAAAVETVAAPSTSVVAPRPTRVIALKPGVNWTESTGAR
jgi:hypothetical protein